MCHLFSISWGPQQTLQHFRSVFICRYSRVGIVEWHSVLRCMKVIAKIALSATLPSWAQSVEALFLIYHSSNFTFILACICFVQAPSKGLYRYHAACILQWKMKMLWFIRVTKAGCSHGMLSEKETFDKKGYKNRFLKIALILWKTFCSATAVFLTKESPKSKT